MSSTLRLRCGQEQGRSTERVRLPGARRLPAATGAWPGPTSWTAAPPARTCWPWPSSSRTACRPSWPRRRTRSGRRPGRRAEPGQGRGPTSSSSVRRAGRSPSTTGWPTCSRDIEYDLRDRLRAISREAEQLIDDADPAEVWDQFADWFHQQVSSAASANFVWAAERARWLAGAGGRALRRGRRGRAARAAFDDQGMAAQGRARWSSRRSRSSGIGRQLCPACAAATAAC